jgi:hypothetical protein
MNSEEEIIIAFLFKRSGKNALKEAEIYLPLSIELGWFSTKESQEFITYALHQHILIKKGGLLTPNFDIEKIRIPLGFFPSKKTFSIEDTLEENKKIVPDIAKKIAEDKNQDFKQIIKQIKQLAIEKNIVAEIAALLVAKQHNVDITSYFSSVETNIFTENEE